MTNPKKSSTSVVEARIRASLDKAESALFIDDDYQIKRLEAQIGVLVRICARLALCVSGGDEIKIEPLLSGIEGGKARCLDLRGPRG